MTEETKALALTTQNKSTAINVFGTLEGFEAGQRICTALARSGMVPKSYYEESGAPKYGDMLLALDMAQRTGASPLMVMQNLHTIQGRPSWSSQFIIASINSSKKFSPLRFKCEDLGEKTIDYTYTEWNDATRRKEKKTGKVTVRDKRVTAWAVDVSGERLEGPPVTIEMAVHEGWYTKNDSKWKTMPDLMLNYRAAAFFGRTYCPEMMMGLPSAEEVQDVEYIDVTPPREPAAAAPELLAPINDAQPAKRGRKPKAETVAEPAAEMPPAVTAAAATMAAAVSEGLVPPLVHSHTAEAKPVAQVVDVQATTESVTVTAQADSGNPFDFSFGE